MCGRRLCVGGIEQVRVWTSGRTEGCVCGWERRGGYCVAGRRLQVASMGAQWMHHPHIHPHPHPPIHPPSQATKRKKGGSLMTAPLEEVLTEEYVKGKEFTNTEFLLTLVVVVPKNLEQGAFCVRWSCVFNIFFMGGGGRLSLWVCHSHSFIHSFIHLPYLPQTQPPPRHPPTHPNPSNLQSGSRRTTPSGGTSPRTTTRTGAPAGPRRRTARPSRARSGGRSRVRAWRRGVVSGLGGCIGFCLSIGSGLSIPSAPRISYQRLNP